MRIAVWCLVVVLVGGCASRPRSTVPPRPASQNAKPPVPAARPTPAARPVADPTPAPGPAAGPEVDTLRDEILVTARTYLGTPYRYGGLSREGIDCSGLVHQVFRTHGRSVPRTSWRQYRFGTPVERHALSPGDLVFFSGRGGSVQHVGIYAGDGWFVHASTHHREVRFDRLDRQYFREHYLGARNPLSSSAAR